MAGWDCNLARFVGLQACHRGRRLGGLRSPTLCIKDQPRSNGVDSEAGIPAFPAKGGRKGAPLLRASGNHADSWPNGPAAGRARRRRGRARGCRGRRRLLLARSPARPPAAPRFSLRLPGPAHLRAPGRGPSCPGRCPGLQRGCRRGPRARAGVAQQRKARRGVGAARPGAPGRGTWEPPRRAPAISARPERAARGWPRVESAGNGARGSGPPTVDYLVCISRAQTTPTPATSSASWACFLPPGSRGAYLADNYYGTPKPPAEPAPLLLNVTDQILPGATPSAEGKRKRNKSVSNMEKASIEPPEEEEEERPVVNGNGVVVTPVTVLRSGPRNTRTHPVPITFAGLLTMLRTA
ncbi:uncharacterized protein LOC144309866 [Canis aureus]